MPSLGAQIPFTSAAELAINLVGPAAADPLVPAAKSDSRLRRLSGKTKLLICLCKGTHSDYVYFGQLHEL